MADLQMVLSEAGKLNRSITWFLKFSTYTDYDDLSGLEIQLPPELSSARNGSFPLMGSCRFLVRVNAGSE